MGSKPTGKEYFSLKNFGISNMEESQGNHMKQQVQWILLPSEEKKNLNGAFLSFIFTHPNQNVNWKIHVKHFNRACRSATSPNNCTCKILVLIWVCYTECSVYWWYQTVINIKLLNQVLIVNTFLLGSPGVGPLAVLSRAVKEKLQVRVMLRRAVDVSSICKGYIVAFDKFCNMVSV